MTSFATLIIGIAIGYFGKDLITKGTTMLYEKLKEKLEK